MFTHFKTNSSDIHLFLNTFQARKSQLRTPDTMQKIMLSKIYSIIYTMLIPLHNCKLTYQHKSHKKK